MRGVICGNYDKYLGLHTLIGKSMYNTFRRVKENVWQKVTNWKPQFLSQVGREILFKAVLQAVMVYTMNVFELPKKLCQELEGMMSKF